MKRQGKSKHDRIIDDLVQELEATGNYRSIETKVEYHRKGCDGEIDVLARPYHGRPIYVEVKSNNTREAWKRAKEQFERCDYAHPGLFQYVYHTPQVTIEYKPKRKR